MTDVPTGTRVIVTCAGQDHAGTVHGRRFNLLTGKHELVIVPFEHPGTFRFLPEPLDVRPASDSSRGAL